MLKNLELGTNELKLALKLYRKIFFPRNNIHREIDQRNQHWFGEKRKCN